MEKWGSRREPNLFWDLAKPASVCATDVRQTDSTECPQPFESHRQRAGPASA